MNKATKRGKQNDISIIWGMPSTWLERKFCCDEIQETRNNVQIDSPSTARQQRSLDKNEAEVPKNGHFSKNNRDQCYDVSDEFEASGAGGKLRDGSKGGQQVDEEKENVREVEEAKKAIPGLLNLKHRRYDERCEHRFNSHSPDKINIPGVIHLNANLNEPAKCFEKNSHIRRTGFNEKRRTHKERESNVERLWHSPVHTAKPIGPPPWFDDLSEMAFARDLRQLHETFTGLIHRNAVLDHWDYFIDTHQQLINIFEKMPRHHLKFYCEMKVDSYFWKLLFYNVREYLRKKSSSKANERLLEIIDIGLELYSNLYEFLKHKYLTSESNGKFEGIAKVAAQKILLCMGDLSRYKAAQTESDDLSKAYEFYKEAQMLIPTNGVPYNQLAIVSIQNRKNFDAVYFHFRSLTSSNAIYTARESLLVLFDEIRKKYEKTENQISPVHQYKNASHSRNQSKSMRKEVWIRPDGERRLHQDLSSNSNANTDLHLLEKRLDEMTASDLSYRFTSIYLYMIGKLYTGIGMESIQEHQHKLIMQFKALLRRHQPFLVKRTKLLKIVAMNICVIEHNAKKAHQELRYQAFQFCNQMFGVILEKSNEMFATYCAGRNDRNEQNFDNLNTLLQFVKIYGDYLTISKKIWEPIRSEEELLIDPWIELGKLFDNIDEVLSSEADDIAHLNIDKNIVLDENLYLNGFSPLMTVTTSSKEPNNISYAKNAKRPNEYDQFINRINKIKEFQETFLTNEKDLVVKVIQKDSSFVLEELNSEIQNVFNNLNDVANDHKSIGNDRTTNEVTNTRTTDVVDDDDEKLTQDGINALPSAVNEQISQLAKLKRELEAKANANNLHTNKLEEILKYVDSKVYIEVRPKYLLTDTNCFIDCWEDFEKLMNEFRGYVLVIPLTVIRELDGLSKGVKLESNEGTLYNHRIHHFDDVSTRAKKSLDFIKNSKTNVKCVTTKGSFINASLFALAEEENVSNDDRILVTALALSKTMSKQTSTDDKCFIQTELVLITTDRNLRVKALSRNLAVSELSEFLQWAQDGNNESSKKTTMKVIQMEE